MDIQTWDVLCVLVCRMYLHVDIDGESEIQKRSKKLCNVKEQTDERKGTFITNVVQEKILLCCLVNMSATCTMLNICIHVRS